MLCTRPLDSWLGSKLRAVDASRAAKVDELRAARTAETADASRDGDTATRPAVSRAVDAGRDAAELAAAGGGGKGGGPRVVH